MKKLNLKQIEKHYRVDDNGGVWSNRRGLYLTPTVKNGYAIVVLPDVGISQVAVHRLVALKYLPPRPDGVVIWHIDDNALNNRADNLEYIDKWRAIYRGRNRGLNRRSYFIEERVKSTCKRVVSADGEVWSSVTACAESFNVSRVSVWKAIKGKRALRGVHIGYIKE